MFSSSIYLVGTFPPPVNGVSLVNSEIRNQLFYRGVQPLSIDLSPSSLDRTWYTRLSRITKVLFGICKYSKTLLSNKNISLYIGLSGGYGQFYETLFIALARLLHVQIFLHHHSCAYLTKRLFHTYLLTQVAGSNATHIVLCPNMGEKLQDMYRSVKCVFVLSNAAILKRNQLYFPHIKETLKSIAFLGNIAPEKGIFEFLDVIASLADVGMEVQALIAGPFQDQRTEAIVLERLSCLSMAKYVGPKYNEEKVAFYEEIDVLLFPTKYIHEAEPLTIHEAMSHAIPVIAWQRGCIKSIISPDAGLVINQTEDFVSKAVEQIKLWQASPQSFQAASSCAAEKFLTMKAEYSKSFDELLSMLAGSSLLE